MPSKEKHSDFSIPLLSLLTVLENGIWEHRMAKATQHSRQSTTGLIT
jgi:hypothetical protein